MSVAPFTGAWIETCYSLTSVSLPQSRPSRARGLKHLSGALGEVSAVAPFTGAWIETSQ